LHYVLPGFFYDMFKGHFTLWKCTTVRADLHMFLFIVDIFYLKSV